MENFIAWIDWIRMDPGLVSRSRESVMFSELGFEGRFSTLRQFASWVGFKFFKVRFFL